MSTPSQEPMQITPPYAYAEIVPLKKEHRVLIPQARRVPPAFRTLNAVPVSLAEFGPIARDYPLVFVSGDQGKTHAAFAVLGLEPGSNLFLMADNTWDRRAYLPAYVRRYPFCMATITVDGQVRQERLVCVEKKALRDKGDQLFGDDGKALPDWERQQQLLTEFEGDLLRTNEFCKTVTELGLLESFTMQAQPTGGAAFSLAGMARVSEAKLAALEPVQLKSLAERGVLGRLYQHIGSLDNFQRLLDRRAALANRRAAPAAQA